MTMKRSRREEDREIETLAMANCLILLKHIAAQTSSKLDRVYKCKTCDRKFVSFQALGGHRASHKRTKLMSNDNIDHTHSAKIKAKTKHACSVCGLEFEMGQALGGHMRRHRADHMEKEREEAVSVPVLPMPVPVPVPVPGLPVPLLKRMKSERVNNLCLDLNLTPYENDLKFGYQIMAPHFTPFF